MINRNDIPFSKGGEKNQEKVTRNNSRLLANRFTENSPVTSISGGSDIRSPNFQDELNRLITDKAKQEGVSPDLIRAIIKAESNGDIHAKSPAGAIGLMQLMPRTAAGMGIDPSIPDQNLTGGIRYLKEMAGRFMDLDKTLAAYNAGPGTVEKYDGIPPYRETQNYIKKIRDYLKEDSSHNFDTTR